MDSAKGSGEFRPDTSIDAGYDGSGLDITSSYLGALLSACAGVGFTVEDNGASSGRG